MSDSNNMNDEIAAAEEMCIRDRGTISKIFAPGLRIGWICAPADVLARISLVKQGADLCGSTFDQVVVEHYFTDTPWQLSLIHISTRRACRRKAR